MPDALHLNRAIREMLLDCGLFNTLQGTEYATAAGYFTLTNIAREEVIFREGDAGNYMGIIHNGTVSVRKRNAQNELVEVAVLRTGRTFGEMAVLDGERRSATCVASTDCQLLTLGKDSLEKMINESPKVAAKLIRALSVTLSRRLRMIDGQQLS